MIELCGDCKGIVNGCCQEYPIDLGANRLLFKDNETGQFKKCKLCNGDFDFYLKSTSATKCGENRIRHKMKRSGPMRTYCINPGCNAVC